MTAYAKILILILLFLGNSSALAQENHPASTFEIMVENYLSIQTALAGDSFEGVAASAKAIAKSAADLTANFDVHHAGIDAANAERVIKLLPGLETAAVELSKTKTLEAARVAFGDLSDAMVSYRNLAAGEVPHIAYCPMAKQSWLQNGKKIANPYYGSAMLRCGSIVEK